MFAGRSVSLVIPAYDEEGTIAEVVSEYRAQPELDEIVVVDNNCKDRTAERARAAGARVVAESRPGYGAALLAGMNAARGEILVLTEADGSFRARDVPKLLAYIDDAGLVVGTRTTRQLIEQGANMRFLLRWGNVAMAKFLELLWYFSHEPRFTDVGCTYRAVTRAAFERMRPHLTETGPSFSPEMMCQALISGCRAVEVPVTYSRRLGGESKHSDGFSRQARTGWAMFKTIVRKRFRSIGLEKPAELGSQPSRAR
jgi:glycosyltransferase involved in cell wall biosynthesis